MTSEQFIMQRLEQLEAVMREHDLWQVDAPDEQAFASQQPFSSTRCSRWNGCSGS